MEKFKASLKNLKEAITSNKKRTLITVGATLAVIVLAIILIFQSVNKTKISIMTPELAKAMTYDQVEEGDEVLDETANVQFDAFFLRDINNDGYAEGIRDVNIKKVKNIIKNVKQKGHQTMISVKHIQRLHKCNKNVK